MQGEYGESERGNFKVIDTIGVPHPYMITDKHVVHASDYYGGRLGERAIKSGEELGIICGVPGCNLSWEEHKQALLVECKKDLDCQELRDYLKSIVDEVEENGYVGFTFLDKRGSDDPE